MKFERSRIHFIDDVFATVTVVVSSGVFLVKLFFNFQTLWGALSPTSLHLPVPSSCYGPGKGHTIEHIVSSIAINYFQQNFCFVLDKSSRFAQNVRLCDVPMISVCCVTHCHVMVCNKVTFQYISVSFRCIFHD